VQQLGIEQTSSERLPNISRAFHGKSENYGQGAPFRVLTAVLTPGLNLFSFNQALELPVLANPPNDIPQGLFVCQQSGSR
jgi:hypothetical protein